ncbi:MAG: DeoR/GlpR family DNA-binding transcription regulator [Amaricoccus sp.]
MVEYLLTERQRAIEARLAREGRVLSAELARAFATSEDTIRRDLRALAAAGRCDRVYGGALPPSEPGPTSARGLRAPAAKAALGAALAALIEPGMTVFLDAGSTNLACARRIAARDVTLITHAPPIAAELTERPGITLITIGGRVDAQVGAAIGAQALAGIAGLRPDLTLLGACGLDARAGLTAQSVEDAAFKRAIAAQSGAVATAADRGKLGIAAPFPVIEVDACDLLALDAAGPPEILAELGALGPRLVLVECFE